MKYTSAEANKLLKTIEAKRDSVLTKERKSSVFTVSSTENVEDLRPEYDFEKTQCELKELNKKIRLIKHAINVFNTTHTVPGFDDMTIDQVLVYLPQLSEEVKKLEKMAAALQRERVETFRTTIIDYNITNYDIAKAEDAYNEARARLNALQLALDQVNTSETIDIDVTLE